MTFKQTVKNIIKYLVSLILILTALGAFWLAAIVQLGGLTGMMLLFPLGAWSLGSVWFLHRSKRLSTVTCRWMAVTLFIIFPAGLYFAWMNVWRLETYMNYRHWFSYESEHFVFHYAPEYSRSHEISAFAGIHDSVFDQNCAYLEVPAMDKIDFYIYEELTEGVAIPDWNEILADDDQSTGHEMTHIIAYHIAGERQKIKLLDEGIATWLNHSKRETDHHCVAWEYIQKNGLPSLSELANSSRFRRHRPPPYYPAASFVGYIIEKYGLDAFRRLWTAGARYHELYISAEELNLAKYFSFIPGERAYFESAVPEIYACSLHDLDTEWRNWLEQRFRH